MSSNPEEYIVDHDLACFDCGRPLVQIVEQTNFPIGAAVRVHAAYCYHCGGSGGTITLMNKFSIRPGADNVIIESGQSDDSNTLEVKTFTKKK
jgi:hypothetical protein